MNIKTKIENNTLHIMLSGELDECSANYARNCLDEILDANLCKTIVFNMCELDFMDSTGIGVLLGRYKKLRNKKFNIFISNPSKTIEKIFNMSGIFEIMPKIS